MYPQQGYLEARTMTLEAILGSISFPGSLESIAKSYLHLKSSVIILQHLSSQQIVTNLLFQGALPMFTCFHLVLLMTKINPLVTLPSLLHSPFRIWSPLPCSHSPSKLHGHHHPEQSIPWQGLIALEDTKTKAYTYLNTSYRSYHAHGHKWTLLGTSFPQWSYS